MQFSTPFEHPWTKCIITSSTQFATSWETSSHPTSNSLHQQSGSCRPSVAKAVYLTHRQRPHSQSKTVLKRGNRIKSNRQSCRCRINSPMSFGRPDGEGLSVVLFWLSRQLPGLGSTDLQNVRQLDWLGRWHQEMDRLGVQRGQVGQWCNLLSGTTNFN